MELGAGVGEFVLFSLVVTQKLRNGLKYLYQSKGRASLLHKDSVKLESSALAVVLSHRQWWVYGAVVKVALPTTGTTLSIRQ